MNFRKMTVHYKAKGEPTPTGLKAHEQGEDNESGPFRHNAMLRNYAHGMAYTSVSLKPLISGFGRPSNLG